MFLGRNFSCSHWMGGYWNDFGGLRFHQFIWVIGKNFLNLTMYRDFFPVILSFMRRLPIIGTILNLPGIRQACSSFIPDES